MTAEAERFRRSGFLMSELTARNWQVPDDRHYFCALNLITSYEIVARGGNPPIAGAGVDLRALVHLARERVITEIIERDRRRSENFYALVSRSEAPY